MQDFKILLFVFTLLFENGSFDMQYKYDDFGFTFTDNAILPQKSFVNTFFDICPSKIKGELTLKEFKQSICMEWIDFYLLALYRGEHKFTDKNFDVLDGNRDGILTINEMDQFLKVFWRLLDSFLKSRLFYRTTDVQVEFPIFCGRGGCSVSNSGGMYGYFI